MNTLNQTLEFIEWLSKLRNLQAKRRINARLITAAHGNFGDHRYLREGVNEMRIGGYRVYYAQEGNEVYLLLFGGDKDSQDRDIARAVKMWEAIQAGETRQHEENQSTPE